MKKVKRMYFCVAELSLKVQMQISSSFICLYTDCVQYFTHNLFNRESCSYMHYFYVQNDKTLQNAQTALLKVSCNLNSVTLQLHV